jgi:hypothetical protein
MYLQTNIDITQFLLTIKKCNSDVFFETVEGDCLNLKSALSQYIFCSILDQPQFLQGGCIRCKEFSDYESLSDFLTEYKHI